MPGDIAMCRNFSCPSRDKCFRYLGYPLKKRWQTWADYGFSTATGKCASHMSLRDGDIVRKVADVDAENSKHK